MKSILYDCRDVGRGCTLRVFDESDMVMQAAMGGSNPVELAQRIADLLEIEMVYVGPAKTRDSAPAMTLDPPVEYATAAGRLGQRSLF